MLNNMVTDRTLTDVEAVKRLIEGVLNKTQVYDPTPEYLNAYQKGTYTYDDLNRVENAVRYVGERLLAYGYLDAIPATQSWTMESVPNEADFSRYLRNVATIRDAITVWRNTPHVPSNMNGFDVYSANDLEQILVDVEQILDNMRDSWFYLGDLYLAEV